MKATIEGVSCEGTPEEIARLAKSLGTTPANRSILEVESEPVKSVRTFFPRKNSTKKYKQMWDEYATDAIKYVNQSKNPVVLSRLMKVVGAPYSGPGMKKMRRVLKKLGGVKVFKPNKKYGRTIVSPLGYTAEDKPRFGRPKGRPIGRPRVDWDARAATVAEFLSKKKKKYAVTVVMDMFKYPRPNGGTERFKDAIRKRNDVMLVPNGRRKTDLIPTGIKSSFLKEPVSKPQESHSSYKNFIRKKSGYFMKIYGISIEKAEEMARDEWKATRVGAMNKVIRNNASLTRELEKKLPVPVNVNKGSYALFREEIKSIIANNGEISYYGFGKTANMTFDQWNVFCTDFIRQKRDIAEWFNSPDCFYSRTSNNGMLSVVGYKRSKRR